MGAGAARIRTGAHMGSQHIEGCRGPLASKSNPDTHCLCGTFIVEMTQQNQCAAATSRGAQQLHLGLECFLPSLSEVRSLSPPRFSGSLIYWVTRPIDVKVTCACSGQANHHTDHVLSTHHPHTPGPITADFLRLVFSTTAGSSSSAPVRVGCGLQAPYSSPQHKIRVFFLHILLFW